MRSGGIRAVAVGTMGRVHLSARSRAPVSAFAVPSERARTRTPESAPIRSLLNVKAATLRQASKSPVQTAPAGRPARPRLRSYGTKRTPALKGSTMTPIAPASDLAVNALTAMLAAMLGRPSGSRAVLERDSSRIQRRTSALHSRAFDRLTAPSEQPYPPPRSALASAT